MEMTHKSVVTPIAEPVELLMAQLDGLELWHAAARAIQTAVCAAGVSRGARLDGLRRIHVLGREQEIIIERFERQMQCTGDPLLTSRTAVALVAHQQAWTRDRLAEELAERV